MFTGLFNKKIGNNPVIDVRDSMYCAGYSSNTRRSMKTTKNGIYRIIEKMNLMNMNIKNEYNALKS